MCGILAVYGKVDPKLAQEQSSKLGHRGPDERDMVVTASGTVLCHERLSIVDLHTGKQPIEGRPGNYLIHNGEIYNHEQLRESLTEEHVRRTHSDSEIILHRFEEKGPEVIHELDGVFAFVIATGDKIFAGRDPLGVKPLYYGFDQTGAMWFASEVKALIDVCEDISEFLPGHYYHSDEGFVRYYQPDWMIGKEPTFGPERLRELLTKSIKKRLMSDVPLGALLSGGLDSSLVASVMSKEMKKTGQKLKTFSVGLKQGSSDLEKAQKVADFIGSEHHSIVYTVEEGIEALRELIHKAETYDVTSIRASTPMYLMTKYIRSQGVKVVLSGEGADEMFGGYLYFTHAPTPKEFHEECVRRVKRLHTADILRADRSTMGAGVEARVPFLDKEFLSYSMMIRPEHKEIHPGKRMEKDVLRRAFDVKEDPYLPDEVLWRQKEQFSDGVGYSWVDELKALAEREISDQEYALRAETFPHNTPASKEAYFYRKIYSEVLPHPAIDHLVKKWIPRWQEDEDPSGRANTTHVESYHPEEEETTPFQISPAVAV